MPRYNRTYKKKANMPMARTRKDQSQDKKLELIEKKVNKLQTDTELKYINVRINGLTPAGVPAQLTNLVLLNGIAIPTAGGPTQSSRDGAQVRMTSISWNFNITAKDVLISGNGVIPLRMIILIDHSPAGSYPVITADPITGNDAIMDQNLAFEVPTQFQQYEQIKRFTFLKDKTYEFQPADWFTNGASNQVFNPMTRNIRGYKKLGQIVKYDSTTNLITSITRNALYVLFLVGPNPGYTITGTTRLYFKD